MTMLDPARSDDLLLAKVLDGDVAAWGELYERLFPRMRTCAVLAMGRAALTASQSVDDIVHDVFTDVLTRVRAGRAPRFDDLDGVARYLAGAVHHMVISLGRQRGRRQDARLGTVTQGQLPQRGPGPRTASALRDGFAVAMRRVEDALLELPEHYRTLIALRYLSEMDSEAICARMPGKDGVGQRYTTPEQVRTALFHAMERLRGELGADAALLEDYVAMLRDA